MYPRPVNTPERLSTRFCLCFGRIHIFIGGVIILILTLIRFKPTREGIHLPAILDLQILLPLQRPLECIDLGDLGLRASVRYPLLQCFCLVAGVIRSQERQPYRQGIRRVCKVGSETISREQGRGVQLPSVHRRPARSAEQVVIVVYAAWGEGVGKSAPLGVSGEPTGKDCFRTFTLSTAS